MQRNQKKNKD